MKFFSTTGAVLLAAFAAKTANGIEFDPEDEGETAFEHGPFIPYRLT